ncbi:DUF2721 domain-containing protein [Ectothiorhodospira sp. BSL-9]|uniref:DUF2721 domain-containing protein n=1 Tax=Ectothiorhodospira sp. BSL-9 TaxID=1442136 RepID=UPI0007B45AD9|nr:DUF2721 domain-containing protein [Ectothiorhodospira sp. BSL-9]ANB03082.1 hypothetical protein ECTOBSL9_2649 [Ectothiorhodospira sp. BSL-9]TVQ72787.1 MAG: DUF2721 domain-containing protein [Chromatiaceae bacterium]
MIDSTSPIEISQVIQFSVAPAFLLVAIAGFLNAFVTRLGRVVDRRRHLAQMMHAPDAKRRELSTRELKILDERARLVHWGMTLCITTAMLVSLTIVAVFLDFLFDMQHPRTVGAMFVLAMTSLIAALGLFLREVFMAVESLTLSNRED